MKGDFFLCPVEKDQLPELSEAILFLKNKYVNYHCERNESHAIYLFSNEEISIASEGVYCFGTLFSSSGANELQLALALLKGTSDKVNTDKNYGSFAVIDLRKSLRIQIDPLGIFSVFGTEAGVYTSSFLAASYACPELTLNRSSLNQRLALGHCIAPKTVFEEIKRMHHNVGQSLDVNGYQPIVISESFDESEAIAYVKDNLVKYFEAARPLCDKVGVDIGLSTGYDSRLILALARGSSYESVQLHTHFTAGIPKHEKEHGIVSGISKSLGLPLMVSHSETLDQMSQPQLDDVLKDNFVYFDGLNSYNMGSLTQTYTSQYRSKILCGGLGVSMNGIGGETKKHLQLEKAYRRVRACE